MNKYVVDLYTEKGRKENLSSLIVGMFVSSVFIIMGFVLFFVLKQITEKVFALLFTFFGCLVFSTSIISLFVSSKRKKKIEELIAYNNIVEADITGIQKGYYGKLECTYTDSFGKKQDFVSEDIHIAVGDVIEKLDMKKIPVYVHENDYFVDIRCLYDSVVDLT